MKPTLKEVTDVFLNAVKETPREMFLPVTAAWKEIKKRTVPDVVLKECRVQDRRKEQRDDKNIHHLRA